eukprot:augustus_masked-scaffold_3-processed-gene-9.60-mRNA-1 protein AED:0.23 eAED:0.23 QI:27/0/0.5/1/1/1/2/0/558
MKQEKIKDRKELKENMLRIAKFRMSPEARKTKLEKDVLIEHYSMYIGNAGALLDDTTIKIVSGRKYGLLGVNGSGKTSLLKNISRGKIDKFPKNISIMHVEQEQVFDDKIVIDSVLESDLYRTELLNREKQLQENLKSSEEEGEEKLNEELNFVYAELETIGSASAEARARKILFGLGFDRAMQDMEISDLSGGWKMRVALCSALFISPDLLLLDEPTNHLDLEACLWLENYLQNYEKTVVIVSHDRKFTNNIIEEVIQLENKKLNYYKGDIDVFEATRERQRKEQKREFEAQQGQIKHMEEFINKFRANAKRASMVQSRIKALAKIKRVENVIDDAEFRFSFPEPDTKIEKLAEVQHVYFRYHSESEMLLQDVDFGIHRGSRIAILGENGCGYVQIDPKTKIAYFAQHHLESLNPKQTPIEFFTEKFHKEIQERGMKEEDVRKHLGNYGVSQKLAEKKMIKLSGGQKSRVAFALCTFNKPNLLILDEPTNHLDLETVDALILALAAFEGGVIYVSHDQNFIEKTADEIYCFENHKFHKFKGEFRDYKNLAIKKQLKN